MLKTLALKELRETIGLAAVALILSLGFVAGGMGVRLLPFTSGRSGAIPFIDDPLLFPLGLIAGVLAVALGFRQTAWESAFGTDQFLLHRPVSRLEMVGMKLLVGVVVLVAFSYLPILVYAWWAATPGTHASPFEWSMTWPFWRMPLLMTVVYLGSFLSGIRPARWVGTRLAPFAGAGFLAFVLMTVPWWSIWWSLGWTVATVLLAALLIVAILFAVRVRDF
jgi:hypothetical protein